MPSNSLDSGARLALCADHGAHAESRSEPASKPLSIGRPALLLPSGQFSRILRREAEQISLCPFEHIGNKRPCIKRLRTTRPEIEHVRFCRGLRPVSLELAGNGARGPALGQAERFSIGRLEVFFGEIFSLNLDLPICVAASDGLCPHEARIHASVPLLS